MKRISILLLLILSVAANAQEAEARKAVEKFFEGFHARDTVVVIDAGKGGHFAFGCG